jgi:alkylation response protein AidB-like acyl-CoA dehydrogenase
VTGAFVPEHRLLSVPALLGGEYAGGHPGEPIAAMTFSSFLPVSLTGALIGMARGTLEHVLAVLAAGRPMGLTTYASAAASPSVQFDVADAASLIDTATLHAARAVGDLEQGVADGAPLPLATRARIRMDVGTVTRCAREAAGLLASAGGMGSFAASSPVQRHLRDLEVAARHGSLSPRLSREVYGRALLGLDEQVVRIV